MIKFDVCNMVLYEGCIDEVNVTVKYTDADGCDIDGTFHYDNLMNCWGWVGVAARIYSDLIDISNAGITDIRLLAIEGFNTDGSCDCEYDDDFYAYCEDIIDDEESSPFYIFEKHFEEYDCGDWGCWYDSNLEHFFYAEFDDEYCDILKDYHLYIKFDEGSDLICAAQNLLSGLILCFME